MKTRILLTLLPLFLAGCIVPYELRKAGPTPVANGAFTVNPGIAWNKVPKDASRTEWEEVWTQNGPMLDTIAFVGGMPEGKTILVQKKKAEKQVPLFRPNMTPQDLASMVEASYRVQGVTVFNTESIDPIDFLGGQGIKVRFNYAPSNGITKNGSCVLRVVDQRLYVMKLEGVSSHYFEASMPEFDRLVASATLPKK